jgi:hypothetical protein
MPSILLFADPGCGECATAIDGLSQALARRPDSQIRPLVITTADQALVEATPAFRETRLPVVQVDRKMPLRLYRTVLTPFLYAVDANGVIRGKGPVEGAGQIRRLLRAVLESEVADAPAASSEEAAVSVE